MMICTCQNLFKDLEREIQGRKYKCDICGKDFVLPQERAEKAEEAVSNIEYAIDNISEAIDNLTEATE